METVNFKPEFVCQVSRRVAADLVRPLQRHLLSVGTGPCFELAAPAKCSLNDNKRTSTFLFLNKKGSGEFGRL